MDEVNFNETPRLFKGICRCCLKESNGYINMDCNNEDRNYSDIIKDTFDVYIENNGKQKLICKNCIFIVQQANTFKTMLINSQKIFLQILDQRTEFVNVNEDPLDIKIEECKQELEDANDSFDTCAMLIGEFSDDDTISISNIEDLPLKDYIRKRELLNRFEKLPYKPLPKISILPKAEPLNLKRNELTGILQIAPTDNSISEKISSHVTEKNAYIKNLSNILAFSNVVPFKGSTSHGYPCLFCRKAFKEPNLLREHFHTTHKGNELKNVLWKYGAECLVVYVDVTNILCNICNKSISNLNVLKTHLVNEHKKIFCTEYTDRIVPFKLSLNNIYECQICGFNFETFGAIERHMNTHFRNYVCSQCGSGYVTKYRLKAHIRNMHSEGFHQCNECSKIYGTSQKLKNHIDTVHKFSKRFKCPHCKERFTEYFKRQKHLVTEHGAVPTEYKCNVCEKVFFKRYNLSRHLKKDHLEERDFNCKICPYSCFTNVELQLHMIRHNGERIFDCKICKKTYARKKTLKEHMRIHLNDRRFSCFVCGQAFIQKCSLKCHMKTHSYQFNEQTGQT